MHTGIAGVHVRGGMSTMRCKGCIRTGWKSLLRHVQEVQEIREGYTFKFRFSNYLIRRLADYAAFESRHGSSLSFTLHIKPHNCEMWFFQVRGTTGEKERIRMVYLPLQASEALYNSHIDASREH